MINPTRGTVLSLTLGGSTALDAFGQPRRPVVSRVTSRSIFAIENTTGDPREVCFSRATGRERNGFGTTITR